MINQNLKFNTAIDINGSVSDVWNALVNPEKIKIYLFGTEALSDWKKGSDLIFRGEWEGAEYKDSAKILEIEPEKILKYNYISSFSQLEDKPENRSTLTFTITKKGSSTRLTLLQEGFENEETLQHSTENWKAILGDMKKLVEG